MSKEEFLNSPFVAESAQVAADVRLGPGTKVWDLVQVREGARVGANCIVGRGAYVGSGVVVGDNCKIQNHALVYEPARLGAGVFIGPAAVLTNDVHPRAVNPDGTVKRASDWEAVGVTIETGAAIGARAVCVAPVRIGAWAMVAAGAVVVRDVPEHALVAGVPARQIGWVSKSGQKLREIADGQWQCDETGQRYALRNGRMAEEGTTGVA